jgi:hypothetical protein
MTGWLSIAPRYCGPPDTGNGGYACGLVAGCIDGPAEVTLRLPPPLDRPLAVEHDGKGSVRVVDGQSLIAEATRLPGPLDLRLPDPVSVRRASAAGARSLLRLHPELHPFPTCFVCGPQREPGDGLRIFVGPVPGTPLSADVWCPAGEFADANGVIRPEFLWAALDCTGGIAALQGATTGGALYLLGRLAVSQLSEVRAGEPYVVIGWRVAAQDRKIMAGSALIASSGQAVAVARATWIRLRQPAGPRTHAVENSGLLTSPAMAEASVSASPDPD